MQDALLAEARSPFGVRILRLDVDVEQQLLVCGDRTGNVLAFHFDAACLHRPGEIEFDSHGVNLSSGKGANFACYPMPYRTATGAVQSSELSALEV